MSLGCDIIDCSVTLSTFHLEDFNMASKIKLANAEIRRLKNDRQACADIKEDCERAMKAGVPNITEILETVDANSKRIDKLLEYIGGEQQ